MRLLLICKLMYHYWLIVHNLAHFQAIGLILFIALLLYRLVYFRIPQKTLYDDSHCSTSEKIKSAKMRHFNFKKFLATNATTLEN